MIHNCFEKMEHIEGTHKGRCVDCGVMFEAYHNWVIANKNEHKKNNPECPDCHD